MSAVLDLTHLALVHTRIGHAARSMFFAVAHVLLIGVTLIVVGSIGKDQFAFADLVSSLAPLLFFAALAFSLPVGPPFLPMITALAGSLTWLALALLALYAQPTLADRPTGLIETLPALSITLMGCGVLLVCGYIGWQSLATAHRITASIDTQRRRLDLLSHYAPPEMASKLAELDGLLDQVSEFDCAILLVDISHFQRKMEVASIVESGKLIQEFHELVGEVVFKNGGVLRHMEGDSLYAVFGLLPNERGSVAQAVLCSQTLAEAAKLWRSERIERGRTPADIFMGIDFGRCVIVPNAHPDRPDFSIIGSPFSAARRMERVARLVAADLAITGHAVHQLEEEGAGELSLMLDHRGPQKVDDRRGVVEVRTWSLPLSSLSPVENVA